MNCFFYPQSCVICCTWSVFYTRLLWSCICSILREPNNSQAFKELHLDWLMGWDMAASDQLLCPSLHLSLTQALAFWWIMVQSQNVCSICFYLYAHKNHDSKNTRTCFWTLIVAHTRKYLLIYSKMIILLPLGSTHKNKFHSLSYVYWDLNSYANPRTVLIGRSSLWKLLNNFILWNQFLSVFTDDQLCSHNLSKIDR